MPERQQAQRYELERVVIVGDDRRAWAGMIAAFLICLAVLAVAAISGLSPHDLAGTVREWPRGTGGLLHAHQKGSQATRCPALVTRDGPR